MGRSTKTISLVLIGPALLGSSLLVSGCGPMPGEVADQAEQEDWVVAEGQEQGDSWGPDDPNVVQAQHQGNTNGSHSSPHRSNIGGFIGGYLGSRAASSATRGGGFSSAPAGGTAPRVGGGTSHFGGASSRGGFGSSAGHSASS